MVVFFFVCSAFDEVRKVSPFLYPRYIPPIKTGREDMRIVAFVIAIEKKSIRKSV